MKKRVYAVAGVLLALAMIVSGFFFFTNKQDNKPVWREVENRMMQEI